MEARRKDTDQTDILENNLTGLGELAGKGKDKGGDVRNLGFRIRYLE